MGQEFVIKSTTLEDKINQLLPSQGGAQAGVDLSASTTIIPIVDLTESAEGSALRQDLQTSFSLTSVSSFSVSNTTTDLITTTGYFRVFGNVSLNGSGDAKIQITDGTTTKDLFVCFGSASSLEHIPFEFNVFMAAGTTLKALSTVSGISVEVITRQIADISGNLVNP